MPTTTVESRAGRGRHGQIALAVVVAVLVAFGALGATVAVAGLAGVPLPWAVDPGEGIDPISDRVAVRAPLTGELTDGRGASSSVVPGDPVVPAVVTATASCLAPDPRDTVAVDVAGVRRQLPLEACGNRVGTRVDVRVSAGDTGAGSGSSATAASEVARIVGTGSDGSSGGTPAATRWSILLTVLAAIAGAWLLVAVGRERRRADSRTAPAEARPRRSAGESSRR